MNFPGNESLTQTDNLFPEEPAQDSPADPSPENEKTPAGQEGEVETPPADLKGSLHKDARFKRVIEERNRLRREREELIEKLGSKEPADRQDIKATSTAQKPAWFAKYFGDDQEAWDGFQQMSRAAKEEAKREALAEFQEQSRSSEEQSKRWQSWVGEQVQTLEEEGETFDKNALFKVMDEYRPTDDEGNLDFRKGLELLRLKTPQKDMGDRKKLADKLNGKGSGSEPRKREGVVTPKDLARMRAMGEL
jgi:hypothetical protein